MMQNRRYARVLSGILPLLVLVCFPSAAVWPESFIDYGGSLAVTAGVENDGIETEALLEDTLSLWVSATLGRFTLMAQGSMVNSLERSYLFDLDAAKLSGRFPGSPDPDSEFAFDAGRFIFSDFTGYILNDKADGLRLEWNFPFTTVALAAAYTGWVIKPNTTVMMSQSDAIDSLDSEIYYAPPRLIETLLLHVPEAFLGQDLRITWIAQQDLRREEDYLLPGDKVNTYYFGVGADGPVLKNLFYDIFGFAGMGTIAHDTHIFSGFFGAGLKYYRQDALSTRYEMRVLYAGGEKGAARFYSDIGRTESSQFLPISKRDTGIVFSPRMSNIAMLELGYALKPLEPLQIDIRGFGFWRAATGPISESGVDQTDRDNRFLGLELDTRAEWRFYSDFGVTAGLGLFLPASGSLGAMYDDSLRIKFTLEAVFAF